MVIVVIISTVTARQMWKYSNMLVDRHVGEKVLFFRSVHVNDVAVVVYKLCMLVEPNTQKRSLKFMIVVKYSNLMHFSVSY